MIERYLRTPVFLDIKSNIPFTGYKMAPCYPLTPLLVDFLMWDFDSAVDLLYPGVPFVRYFDYLLVPVFKGHSIVPSDIGQDLDANYSIRYTITTLTPGCHNFTIPGGFLRLHTDGSVIIENTSVYPYKW